MTQIILREAILPRISGIQKNLQRLREIQKLPFVEFSTGDNYDLVQHNLRLALEGVFHISTHILSRLPGGRATEYKEVARKLGELKVVPSEFAEKSLVPMAGLRNILVHTYSDIDPNRLYDTISNHLSDFDEFLSYIKIVLQNPDTLGLIVS